MHLDWDNVASLINWMSRDIAASHAAAPFQHIVAVARGGLIPASLIMQRVDIPELHIVRLQSYNAAHEQGGLEFKYSTLPSWSTRGRVLIVDDILDTGATMDWMKKLYPGAATACLVVKGSGRDLACDFRGTETLTTSEWVTFPWEPA